MHVALVCCFVVVLCTNIEKVESWGSRRTCLVSTWTSWNWLSNGTATRSRVILRYPSAGQTPCPHLEESKKDCEVSQWTNWQQGSSPQKLQRTREILDRRTPTTPCPPLIETYNIEKVLNETTKETGERFAASFFFGQGKSRSKREAMTAEVRDLLIILDSSGSVPESDYTEMKSELGKLLGLLCPQDDPFDRSQPMYQQVALVIYSSTVEEVFTFDSYSGINAIKNIINKAPYIGRSTCTGDAFEYGKKMFQTDKGARTGQSGVRQEVLIITDGQSNCGKRAIDAARSLQDTTGAEVFGLMVGIMTTSGVAEVTDYVTSPQDSHLFRLAGFVDFNEFVQTIEDILKQDASLFCAHFQ